MGEEPPVSVVRTVLAQPVHVTLSQSAKGRYYWEISVHAADAEEAREMYVSIDEDLKRRYGAPEGGLAGAGT
jgi:hypothetical protein